MQNTGVTAEYLEMSASCRPCLEVAAQIEGYFAAGGYVKTDGWTIHSAATSGGGKTAAVTLTVTSAPTRYATAHGQPEQTMAGGRGVYLVSLRARRSTWVVSDLEAVAS